MLTSWLSLTVGWFLIVEVNAAQCPDYLQYSTSPHDPREPSRRRLPFMRPIPQCRTFTVPEVEAAISTIKTSIADSGLARLFENCFPNTLDTAIRWHGLSADSGREELTFIVTGDIDAMWLRDSAQQLSAYSTLLRPSNDINSLASLFRGAINLQTRYILQSPFCNAFHAPVEAGIPPARNDAASDAVSPPYDPSKVFECKYELDSLASFLMLSVEYFEATGDVGFFSRQTSRWTDAVDTIVRLGSQMSAGTYDPQSGNPIPSTYTFTRQTNRGTETLNNDGQGNPVGFTGLVRSAFRPSDDATTYQFLVPSNIMFSTYLARSANIASRTGRSDLAGQMTSLSRQITRAVNQFAVVSKPTGQTTGRILAYEVDGFGSTSIMDDANLPSLLGIPLFANLDDFGPTFASIYARTRTAVLSTDNPYMMRGPLEGIGSPHTGLAKPWPMSVIVRAMTTDNKNEIAGALTQLLDSTAGLGLIHESVDSRDPARWTRQWFSWANGMFGRLIVRIHSRHPDVLRLSFS